MKRQIKRWLRGVSAPPATPISVPSQRDLGDAARDSGDWATAVTHYQSHLDAEPLDFAIQVQLGHALKEAGFLIDAENQYKKAAELDQRNADLLLSQGHLAKLLGKVGDARRFYQASFDVDGNNEAGLELGDIDSLANVSGHPIGSLVTFGVVDRVYGSRLEGWAKTGRGRSPTVEIVRDGKVIATATAGVDRKDVLAAGLGPLKSGFAVDLRGKVAVGDEVQVRLKGSGTVLENGSIKIPRTPGSEIWTHRFKALSNEDLKIIEDKCTAETAGLKLSIVMPVYNTPKAWLEEAIDSVLDQWCRNFELICVDDASTKAHVRDVLEQFAAADDRIKVVTMEVNGGIGRATNAGIAKASGDYIAFMDHDDYLEPDAVYRMLDATLNGADIVYSDEALTGRDIDDIWGFVNRTAFSHDYYLSHPYFVHLIAVKREIVNRIGGYDETLKISGDVDFVLRAIEQASTVAHVPSPLYRWRTHESSTGHSKAGQVTTTMVKSLNRHLGRMGIEATASAGLRYNTYRIDYPDDREKTLIIIPTKDRVDLVKACLDSLWATVNADEIEIVVINHESREGKSKRYFDSIRDRVTIFDYSGVFNYSKMNNAAFRTFHRDQKYVLFLNNDIEAIEPGWLERMRSLAGRADVGAVGATLLFGEGTVQHAGVVVGIGGAADHSHKFQTFKVGDQRELGHNCSLVATRDYSAVTAACMMLRCEVFEGVGGFDEEFVIGFNDTDLSLRISHTGLAILNDPYAVLFHHESATRSKTNQIDHPADGNRFVNRWRALLSRGDPFYNPWLSKRADHTPSGEQALLAPARERPVKPALLPLAAGRFRRVSPVIQYHMDPSRPVAAAAVVNLDQTAESPTP